MEAQKRKDIIEAIAKETAEMEQSQNEKYLPTLQDSRETMRNLSLVIGGVATGSLVVLSSSIPTVHILIILGVFILFFEIILIFGYLLHVQNRAAEKYFALRKETIYPRVKILIHYNEMNEGKITPEKFDKELIEVAKNEKEYRYNVAQKVLDYNPHTDNFDLVFIGLLALGSLFIVLGMIAPYFCNHWGIMCV